MILDSILESKSENKNESANLWLELILKYQKESWFNRFKKKRDLKKVSKTTTPTIDVLIDMANTIQLLGKYFLYYNSKEKSLIASYKIKKSNIIVFPLSDEKDKKDWKCIIDINESKNVKLTIVNPDVQYSTSWNEQTINSVIQNKYEMYTFEYITNILMDRFFGLIISYI